jgi:drug/metabolite transporter (DMT)-like permease
VHVLSRWLLVLVLVMYAAAAYLARGERRVTIRRVGWAFVIVGLLLLVTRKLAGNYIIDAVTSPTYRGTGHRVWLIGTTILGEIGWAAVLYGLMLVIAMVFAGDTTYARAARRAVTPVLIARPLVAWGSAGGLLLVLVLWGGTHALRTWWGVALFAALFAVGLVALRRQVVEEAQAGGPPRDTNGAPEFEASKKKLALR